METFGLLGVDLMPARMRRRKSKTEIARRGDAIYETRIKPHVTARDQGKFAAIDVNSGEFEIGSDKLTVIDRLQERQPHAQCWLVRIGSRYVTRFGGRLRNPS